MNAAQQAGNHIVHAGGPRSDADAEAKHGKGLLKAAGLHAHAAQGMYHGRGQQPAQQHGCCAKKHVVPVVHLQRYAEPWLKGPPVAKNEKEVHQRVQDSRNGYRVKTKPEHPVVCYQPFKSGGRPEDGVVVVVVE